MVETPDLVSATNIADTASGPLLCQKLKVPNGNLEGKSYDPVGSVRNQLQRKS
jgi:hypothetical protein